jgi:hypothetical protein
MSTTTIRVDTDTHASLVQMSRAAGASLIDTVSDAVEALRRQRFARQVTVELADLSDDQEAWEDYVAEAGATSVTDGLS